MSVDHSTEHEQLTPAEAARVDRTCDEFEQAWQAAQAGGTVPHIARYLDGCGAHERTILVLELVALDRACRERYGVAVRSDDYAGLGAAAEAPIRAANHVPGRDGGTWRDRPEDWPRLPGLELLEVLGSGGMGVVFKARQLALDRFVAVKLMRDARLADSEDSARFLQEARAVASLQHAHLVQVYEFGEVPSASGTTAQPYLVLEYVAGGSLTDLLRGAPQPPANAVRLVETLADAIHYAHTQGIVHRDLKPANVLLTVAATPKITDFGLAKFLGGSDLTRTGDVLGTPSYMAPEQTVGNRGVVAPAVDVYGLGAILYEVLTGRPPFRAETTIATVLQVQQEEPVPPRRLQPTVPRDLETICLKCLRKDAGRRYATAQELADDLRRFRVGEPIRARPVGSAERVVRWCRRKPVLAGLMAAVVLLFGVVAVGGPLAAFWIARQRDLAQDLSREARAELWKASLQQARADRRSGQVGQRFGSLEALTRAAAIRPSAELRNETIACLALPDLRLVQQWAGNPMIAQVAFDAGLERYARIEKATITVRQVADDRVIYSLPSPGEPHWAIFSKDGRYLAARYVIPNRGGYCCVWELERRQIILESPSGWSFNFSPDSRRIAISQPVAGFVIRELQSGAEIRRIETAPSPHATSFHPREPLVAISSGPGRTVEIWALDTGKLVKTLPHPRRIGQFAWGDGGRLLAVGTYGGAIHLYEVDTWRPLAVLHGHTVAVDAMFFHPTENVLVSAAHDDMTRLWDACSGRQLLAAPGFVVGIRADGRQLAFSHGDQLSLWEVTLATECRTLVHGRGMPSQREALQRGPWGLAYHPRGHLLASAGNDGVRLWDPRSAREQAHLPGEPVDSVLFHSSGNRLIGYGQGGLRCWTLRSDPGAADDGLPLGPARLLEGPAHSYVHSRACCWCPGERSLAVIANQGESLAVVQPFEAPGELVEFKGRKAILASVAVSPDSRWLAAGAFEQDGIVVWERATGKAVTELSGSRPGANGATVAFSPDGQWLVAGGQGEYRLWRVGSWEAGLEIPREQLENHPGRMAFTSDGKVLALAWSRHLVRLVDAASGQELATLTSPDPQPITQIRFSPDEQQLAVATENFVIHLWDLRQLRRQLAELGLDWSSSAPMGKRD
jgi:WD40 repeat protein/tRNA A-37 threonylcarbamoyl transferase component Bud32